MVNISVISQCLRWAHIFVSAQERGFYSFLAEGTAQFQMTYLVRLEEFYYTNNKEKQRKEEGEYTLKIINKE